MSAFQILDKEGQPVSINKIDEIAAKFWKQEPHPKSYAVPKPPSEFKDEVSFFFQSNWFDAIGWNIAHQGNSCTGWANVVASMISHMNMNFIDTSDGYKDRPVKLAQFEPVGNNKLSLPEETEIRIYATLKWAEPYVALINHFQSLGFTPKQIKD